MTASAKSVVDSFREVVQDLLVPELKALRVSVEGVRTEMQMGDQKLQISVDALREEMKIRDERLHAEMRLRDEQMKEAMRVLAQKLDFAIDIRERLAGLEARLPRQ